LVFISVLSALEDVRIKLNALALISTALTLFLNGDDSQRPRNMPSSRMETIEDQVSNMPV